MLEVSRAEKWGTGGKIVILRVTECFSDTTGV